MTCPQCRSALPSGALFCSTCGRHLGASDAVTVLAADETRLSDASEKTPSTSQDGWLTSSGTIDHGRFAPGMVLENRYRILGLLGRGGMGEVYRADDLRLGQPVALKFLPPELSRDATRVAQLHNEVRTARHVSHPNVCRVYDIGELDQQMFITMEYVDGEDLSLLLRRIGRLPEDKGLEIARQICAGLAAAHDRGVLHRDLKPANIMLDGSGKVRIMDFSLAAGGEVQDIRAGTPAYMAPEQIAGREVTVRSDIYALGLVLYEIFTGRRAFDAPTLGALVEQQQAGAFVAPTAIVKSLDPAIERAIVRCLERDPASRPASAIRVSASLPGGDPLSAAIAAGETPSPEMVAAAGGDRAAISPFWGAFWMALAVLGIALVAGMVGRLAIISRVPLDKQPAALEDRADQMRESFGWTSPVVDRGSGFTYDVAYVNWVVANRHGADRWGLLPGGVPPAVRFWSRTSPVPLVPVNQNGVLSLADPPVTVNGMTLTILDTRGRLQRFEAAPQQVESAPAPAAAPVDWTKLFAAAGLDPAAFSEIPPPRTPPSYADERKAWSGVLPGTDIRVTIDAAAYRGRPTYFDIVPPWRTPGREPGASTAQGNANPIYIYLLLGGAALAAWGNVRRGRADHRGASRLAIFMVVLLAASWAVGPHVGDRSAEQQRFFAGIGIALFIGAVLYMVYLGLEPYVRRSWPTMLIGWSRLLAGGLRDPLVGRDVLIGVVAGAALAALDVGLMRLPVLLGEPEGIPLTPTLAPLMGARGYLGTLLAGLNSGLQSAFIMVFQIAIFRAVFDWVLRSLLRWTNGRWPGRFSIGDETSERVFFATAVLGVALLSVLDYRGDARALSVALGPALSMTLTLVVLLRLGMFAAVVMTSVNIVLLRMPLTLDGDALYAGLSWLTMAGFVGLAAAGWWTARRSAASSQWSVASSQ